MSILVARCWTICCSLALFLACCDIVAAQSHRDVNFVFENGQIVPAERLVAANFPRTGISRQFTSNPGFSSERDQGGGGLAGEQLIYHVLDDLLYWNQGQFVTPNVGTQLRIENNPPASVPDTIVTPDSGMIEGQLNPFRNRIGQAAGTGDIHSHVDFFLEPLEADDPAQLPWVGAYGLKLSLQSSRTDARPSEPMVFVFNFGLPADDFLMAQDAFRNRWLVETPGIAGDLDANGQLDAADIDRLSQAIREARQDTAFDLDGNGVVNGEDRTFWIESLKKTYSGDADLDGLFNSTDLVTVFQQGEYEDSLPGNSGWAEGDWNGDLDFDSGDFVAAFQGGGFEQGPRAALVSANGVLSVPEPSATWLLVVLAVGRIRRHVTGAGKRIETFF